MLALGMCASVAIFAFVDAALIKPLPYKDPKQLVGVYEKLENTCPSAIFHIPTISIGSAPTRFFSRLMPTSTRIS